jgi:hypothetical protein
VTSSPTRSVPAPAVTSVTAARRPAARALAHHAMTSSRLRQSESLEDLPYGCAASHSSVASPATRTAKQSRYLPCVTASRTTGREREIADSARRWSTGSVGAAARRLSGYAEDLDRGARGVLLWLVHGCVFGVLALESEPVGPRL